MVFSICISFDKGPIINYERGGRGGGVEDFSFTQKYFGRLLQKHQIYFAGYSVIRRKFSGATQKLSVDFQLFKV